jgi:uncharacterized protein
LTKPLLGRRASYPFASERATAIYNSKVLTILRLSLEDELAALEVFTKYADQQVSFADAISFVLMRKQNVTRVFSFDQHFAYAGFELLPDTKL